MTDNAVVIPIEQDARERKRQEALLKAIGLDRVPVEQREIALAIAKRYELDLLLKHLVLVDGRPYITRDGLLHIAHRSGAFDGIEVSEPELTKLEGQGDYWTARALVYRKDMSRPFGYSGRYPAKGGNQRYAPEMAVKVAEVMALRRAFDVSAPVIEERWDIDSQVSSEPEPTITETIAQRRAALAGARTATPTPTSPGTAEAGNPMPAPEAPGARSAGQPQVEVAGQADDAPAPATPEVEPEEAKARPHARRGPSTVSSEARADEVGETAPSSAPSVLVCDDPSPYGDGHRCELVMGHRNAHRSPVATWT